MVFGCGKYNLSQCGAAGQVERLALSLSSFIPPHSHLLGNARAFKMNALLLERV